MQSWLLLQTVRVLLECVGMRQQKSTIVSPHVVTLWGGTPPRQADSDNPAEICFSCLYIMIEDDMLIGQ